MIGEFIRKKRKEQKLTLAQLSNIGGITRVTLAKIEKGQLGAVSMKTVLYIIDALGYKISITEKPKNNFGIPNLDELKENEYEE